MGRYGTINGTYAALKQYKRIAIAQIRHYLFKLMLCTLISPLVAPLSATRHMQATTGPIQLQMRSPQYAVPSEHWSITIINSVDRYVGFYARC